MQTINFKTKEMKTEPTEALKIIDFWGFYHSVDEEEYIDFDNSTKAVNLAFKEGQSNPKIKQLEWDGKEELAFFTAQTNIGEYMIDSPHNDGIFVLMYTTDESGESLVLHMSNSVDELKSFAQQDFEARIKECLIIE